MLKALLPAVAIIASLTACSSDPQTQQVLKGAIPFQKRAPATANPLFLAAYEADAPGVAAVTEQNTSAIAVLLRQARSDVSGVDTMIAADGSQLMLKSGVLVGTRGFGNDLMAAEVSESTILIQSLGSGVATRLMTFINGNDNTETRAFKCDIYPGGTDSVFVGDTPVSTRMVTEHCRGGLAEFFNYYWVVPQSREIVQSTQWASPLTGKLSLRKVPSVRN
ncbi:group 4 capsule polysaccharide lipoprotein GfcB/YjbF [Rhodobacter sp. JA431]|uniref:YjbF family lipoprotein n=1 Tax=Rhodobacter sp. JA431 TaxID=570013 RepID=UPI000BCF9E42|nr:YjbF family lipoprotein [Rhodobacter sp. JA431]SOB97650.1 group 4 capsule polysaccharide lipoprotein GfcB/YjbF [Rhodobacter sp. JA431]